MSVATQISLEQYFDNPTKPASEYLYGELFQKAMPTNLHSDLQFWIAQLLFQRFGQPRYKIRTEQNLRLGDQVVRVPDVCVLRRASNEAGPAVTEPPLLCIEILSPSDRFSFTVKKCQDYLRWGVDACWILDPEQREAWVVSLTGFNIVAGSGSLEIGAVILPLSEIFPSGPE